jgi:hypothetical protein
VLEEQLGKRIVHEYLEDLAVFEAHKQTLAPRRAPNNFDVAYDRVQDPFTLSVSREIVPGVERVFQKKIMCAWRGGRRRGKGGGGGGGPRAGGFKRRG